MQRQDKPELSKRPQVIQVSPGNGDGHARQVDGYLCRDHHFQRRSAWQRARSGAGPPNERGRPGYASSVTEVIDEPVFISECCSTRIAVVMRSGVDRTRNSGRFKGQATRAPGRAGTRIEAGPIYPGAECPMPARGSACTKASRNAKRICGLWAGIANRGIDAASNTRPTGSQLAGKGTRSSVRRTTSPQTRDSPVFA